jgi:hypothetical protein
MAGLRRAARVLETAVIVAVVVFVVSFIVSILMPAVEVKRDGGREAQVKYNLHEIQLAIERFAVDHAGAYPTYLTGGEAQWSAVVDMTGSGEPFKGRQSCQGLLKLADPLLREGYIDSYPRNPFVRNGITVHQAQLSLPLNAPGGDPLRNGVDTGRLYGTRFGAYCTSMGQLLGAKYYYPVFNELPGEQPNATGLMTMNITGMTAAPIPGLPPGADTTYPCWNVWTPPTSSRIPFPGEFIYAGMGPIIAVGPMTASGGASAGSQTTVLPGEIDDYILAAFSGPRTAGQDVMDGYGIPFSAQQSGKPGQPGSASIRYGNPDGIKDGIIIVLTAGETYEDRR